MAIADQAFFEALVIAIGMIAVLAFGRRGSRDRSHSSE